MVGNFEISGDKPVTREFKLPVSADTVLTGFSTLQMSPRHAGIKVGIDGSQVDTHNIKYQLHSTPTLSLDKAVTTYADPARLGSTVQHGTVGLDSGMTDQVPPLSIPVTFKTPYTTTPIVSLWLSELDFPTGTRLGIEARAIHITPTGFTVFVTGLMDLPRKGNQVKWVAYVDKPDVVSGNFILGKGTDYRATKCHPKITKNSEVFMAFNMFSGPIDAIDFEINSVELKEGALTVGGRVGDPKYFTMGVVYLIFPVS